MGAQTLDTVDLIACGYEWICPKCDHENKVPEITDTVSCEYCYTEYDVGQTEHAFY